MSAPDQVFVRRFESLEIEPGEFDHSAHVRLAWAYLQDQPLPEAMILFRDSLKQFAAHHGKTDLYHETMTFAFIFLIHERMHGGRSAYDWQEFARENPDLLRDGRALLLRLYREETLSSALAKRIYQSPDRGLRS